MMSRSIDHGDSRHEMSTEYWLYFVPILLTALPTSFVQWLLALARHDVSRANPGPLRRAIRTAQGITPQIFSA
jgi:PufQ cytochrome subunit